MKGFAKFVFESTAILLAAAAFPAMGKDAGLNGITCKDYSKNRITLERGSSDSRANFTLRSSVGYLEGGFLSELMPVDQPYKIESAPVSCESSASSPYVFECQFVEEKLLLTGVKDDKTYEAPLFSDGLTSTFSLYEQTLHFAQDIKVFKRLAKLNIVSRAKHVVVIGKDYDFFSGNDDSLIGCRLLNDN